MFSMQPLASRTLPATLALVARCFPTDIGFKWAMPLCALAEVRAFLQPAAGFALAQQWVAVTRGGQVIGTYGLFASPQDFEPGNRFVALNWFCVDPEFRGQGMGRRLWEEVLREATATGAQHLMFYSSTEPHHQSAEKLYLGAGCARRVGYELPTGPGHFTYFDRPLGNALRADAATVTLIDRSLEWLIRADWDEALIAAAEQMANKVELHTAA